ncbi:MAG: hypothetical protein MRY83_05230 [Flavobacteriales bacterium]|nr:hypothetical protein [Flavobacteriales bacterium]
MKYLSLFLLSIPLLFVGCKKDEYKDYDNLQVICNTYTGSVMVTSTGSDPGADFTGDGDSGEYCFVWENSKNTADANFDITTPTGSVQLIVNDAKGDEVLNETRSAGGDDTFSGVTSKGKKGKWLVKFIFTNFDGDGSYSFSPGD